MFARAHLATGDDRYAELARQASSHPRRRIRARDAHPRGSVLEEAPSDPPAHALNGWMSALWGLWDVQLGLDDARARDAFDDSLSCLRAFLPTYDTGWWTLYSLYSHTLKDLAQPIYHRFHVTQLEVYHRLTGLPDIEETRARWAGYDRPAVRIAAVTQKAAFAAIESRRRRAWQRSYPNQ